MKADSKNELYALKWQYAVGRTNTGGYTESPNETLTVNERPLVTYSVEKLLLIIHR
jgi:hypothetical protein